MASASKPLVSIGMPLHNEERFINAALESLRAQDYPNFEIIVSDNASTDRTFEICQQLAATDPRIRLERAQENRGATAGFSRLGTACQIRFRQSGSPARTRLLPCRAQTDA